MHDPLVLRVRPLPAGAAQAPLPRFGFVVGIRVGGAVTRNRLKRRLREAARQSGARGAADLVVIARARARDASYRELERVLRSLLRQAGLLPRGGGV